ncbi:ROK family protein [Kitasatospora sp. NBC_01287]|uniref:ROK family transcriptional regulator n=1 Tax=Kitasatospora sp. NBC_01287 TaxID=2903573 RepID=UPI00224EB4E7|nr:ROK family protein [Kitasatospora sp. NBC_01287]MCX4744664.1 ROK family protein [Kitasatospora sp. NBC_01287]
MTTARTATPSTARAINDRLALDLLLGHGPLTATELRTLTGLSRPTIADLLERLQRGGLVAIVGERGEQRRGPNARLYALRADRAHVAGIDARISGVTLIVADLTGRTLASAALPVEPGQPGQPGHPELPGHPEFPADEAHPEGPADPARPAGPPAGFAEQVLRTLLDTARRAGAHTLHTVAIGAPGLIDPATGALSSTSRLQHWHARLVATLRAGLDCEVLLENEANLAGIAEHRLGAATDRDTFVLLWLGHGTGASVVLDGRLRRGASGGTGEIGFLPVPGTGGLPDTESCDGGFHSLAGAQAVCALARSHGLPVSDGAEDAGGAGPAEAVVRAAVAAGPAGEPFLDELADRVAIGVSALSVILDPGCVVLGGEVGRAGGVALADRVAVRLARLSPLRTEVRASTTGGDAVLSGAVLTASDVVRRDLFGGLDLA